MNERPGESGAVKAWVQDLVDDDLRHLNFLVEIYARNGDQQIQQYFSAAKEDPQFLYLILALSNELTSHSFPVVFGQFKDKVLAEYGKSKISRYIHEKFGDAYLSEFFFTLTLFGRLEEVLTGDPADVQQLAEMVFSEQRVKEFLKKPALLGRIVWNIAGFQNQEIKDILLRQILKVGEKNVPFAVLLKMLSDHHKIPSTWDAQIKQYLNGIQIPALAPVWQGPSKEWIKPGNILEMGIYWDATGSEKPHYEEFPKIFAGTSGNPLYRKFTGYVDRSKESAADLKRLGADKVLVKYFPKTGRTIKIYLFSKIPSTPQSPFFITVSRGHAGHVDNGSFELLKDSVFVASQCRSMGDVDSLLIKNPQVLPITGLGTLRAAGTNPLIYYFLQHLGEKNPNAWGSWKDVKRGFAEALPVLSRDYDFSEGIGSTFAVELILMREMGILPNDDALLAKSEETENSSTARQIDGQNIAGNDHAMAAVVKNREADVSAQYRSDDLGGIDFNPEHLQIQTEGKGPAIPYVPLPLNSGETEDISIDGLVPVILEIFPVSPSPQLLLGSATVDSNTSRNPESMAAALP